MRIGTRGSLLAKTQTEWALSRLREAQPDVELVTVIINTTGDIQQQVPFSAIGTKGIFVKEIEQALLNNEIDAGVHSLKDMPGSLPEGLVLNCIPAREDPYDAFVSNRFDSLDLLPPGAAVGTSSARRKAQITAYRSDLRIVELRGNLDTRLAKLDRGDYDAIIVACAGLRRLDLAKRIRSSLPGSICLPAVGQGALAFETRRSDLKTAALLALIHDTDTADCVSAERSLLSALGGGCSVPIAAYAELTGDRIDLTALVASPDGSTMLRAHASGHRSNWVQIGADAAATLFSQGASGLLSGAAA